MTSRRTGESPTAAPRPRPSPPSVTADRQALIISRSVSRSRRIADAWLRRPVVEGGDGEASLLEKEAVNSRDTEFRKSERKKHKSRLW